MDFRRFFSHTTWLVSSGFFVCGLFVGKSASISLPLSKMRPLPSAVLSAKPPHFQEKTPIQFPKGLYPVSRFYQSRTIGTAKKPTIEGGEIQVDASTQWALWKAPPAVIQAPSGLKKPLIQHILLSPAGNSTSKVSAHRLRRILEKAIREGQLQYVLAQTAARHLPAEVALVPLVESAYQTKALSPKGALGAWQIMPQTAKALGLPPQKRTDFYAETPAALQYLASLHTQLGDWNLAYAAYNAGPTRVQRALLAHPHAHDFAALGLPVETQHYVQQLQTAKALLLQDAVV